MKLLTRFSFLLVFVLLVGCGDRDKKAARVALETWLTAATKNDFVTTVDLINPEEIKKAAQANNITVDDLKKKFRESMAQIDEQLLSFEIKDEIRYSRSRYDFVVGEKRKVEGKDEDSVETLTMVKVDGKWYLQPLDD